MCVCVCACVVNVLYLCNFVSMMTSTWVQLTMATGHGMCNICIVYNKIIQVRNSCSLQKLGVGLCRTQDLDIDVAGSTKYVFISKQTNKTTILLDWLKMKRDRSVLM